MYLATTTGAGTRCGAVGSYAPGGADVRTGGMDPAGPTSGLE